MSRVQPPESPTCPRLSWPSEHHSFHGFKHFVVPIFGLVANVLCMLFYIVGPFAVTGMSVKEPFIALGVVAVWGIYGAIYFAKTSKTKAKPVFAEAPQPLVTAR